MDKNKVIEKLNYIIIFAISTIILEMATFLSMNMGILPTYILFDISYIFIISSILFLMDNRKRKIALIVFLFTIQLILNCVNICYYNMLGDIFSFDLIRLGAETIKAFDISYIDYSVFFNIAIYVLSITTLVNLTKKYKVPKTKKNKLVKHKTSIKLYSFALLLAIFMFISSFGVGIKMLGTATLADCSTTDNYYIAKSDSYLYENFQFKQEAFKKFGTFGFYIKSIENLIFKDTLNKEEIENLKNYIQEGEVSENNNAPLKDKNLIVIMLESFDWFAIDPYCTPTLFELVKNQAQTFTNFRARNKTDVSESIGILGNSVKDYNFQSLSQDKTFKPLNSLAYKFKNKGYSANYFHSYDGNFYDRYSTHKQFGFENVYSINETNLDKNIFLGCSNLEEDFLKYFINELAPTDKQFFSFYTTVGTHGTYTHYNERYEEFYEFYDANLPYIKTYLESQGFKMSANREIFNCLKKYKCAAMDTDRMIKYLIDYLTDNNLIDNTTIVMYADHNCYLNDLHLLTRYGTVDVSPYNSDCYNIPFLIYDKTLGSNINNTFCNTYDIYPTICELFGLSYNKNLTQGYNIFNNENIKNSVFVSNLTAMFNDKLYSHNINDVINFSNENLSEEEITTFQKNAINFFEKQNKIDNIYIYKLYNVE